jgi:hypothetical protein
VAQVGEHLFSKDEALSSYSRTERERERERETERTFASEMTTEKASQSNFRSGAALHKD